MRESKKNRREKEKIDRRREEEDEFEWREKTARPTKRL
jgi:hypothetical protein